MFSVSLLQKIGKAGCEANKLMILVRRINFSPNAGKENSYQKDKELTLVLVSNLEKLSVCSWQVQTLHSTIQSICHWFTHNPKSRSFLTIAETQIKSFIGITLI